MFPHILRKTHWKSVLNRFSSLLVFTERLIEQKTLKHQFKLKHQTLSQYLVNFYTTVTITIRLEETFAWINSWPLRSNVPAE